MQIDEPLWTSAEMGATCGALNARPWYADGVRVTTRGLMPGDLYIALDGIGGGGHAGVAEALSKGAIAALVHEDVDTGSYGDQRLVHVADTGAALRLMAMQARDRSPAVRVACTDAGDAGLAGTLLDVAVREKRDARIGAMSLPLRLARLPRSARFGVFDLGAGDAGSDARLIRPQVALLSAPDKAENIEILEGLEKGAIAVIDRSRQDAACLVRRACRHGVKVMTVSLDGRARVRASKLVEHAHCTCVSADIAGVPVTYKVGLPGRAWAMKSLMLMGLVRAAGADLGRAAMVLAGLGEGSSQDWDIQGLNGGVRAGFSNHGQMPWRAERQLLLAE